MSTTKTGKFTTYFFVCAFVFIFNAPIFAQYALEARIKIDSSKPQTVEIKGNFSGKDSAAATNKNWSFTNEATAAENLADRITDFKLMDEAGRAIAVKKFSAGEYLADEIAAAWSYTAEIKTPPQPNALAHVSWFGKERGILMLSDLFPQFTSAVNQPAAARVEFDLPAGWKIISREKQIGANVFTVENVEKAIFLIGKNWRNREISVGGANINFVTADEWQFSDADAEKIVRDIFVEYKNLFGEAANERVQIAFVRFPPEVKSGRWQAETRGANLTVASSDMPFKTQALQRLHEQLRHEFFHLWMPNNLALAGNYAWFYEGFTVYYALKTGVKMNRIRFEDFLDTLAQAYNLDNFQTRTVSLLDSSRSTKSGAGNSQIYARGMIVAFLCDAQILRVSRGRRSIANVFEQIYRKHRKPNVSQEANQAILNVLNDYKETHSTIEKYVRGSEKIDWKTDLASAGIEQIEENSFVRLKVAAKPNGRQKDLLDYLGYNNWRKMSAETR